MISATVSILVGILMATLGLFQAQETMNLPISPYALLGGACLCLLAAAILGVQMTRKTPLGKSKG
jgi:hypothetical protein